LDVNFFKKINLLVRINNTKNINENAIKSAQKAADLDPSLQGSVDAFVNGLQ